MSKIRSAQNKEIIVAGSLFAVIVLQVIINLMIIVSGLIRIYLVQPEVSGKDPIDTATVNEAIKQLKEE
jgi:hypothetical protein